MKTMKAGLILLFCLFPVMLFGAIYKTVDEHGNIVFTDSKSGVQNAEEVELKPVTPLPPVDLKHKAPVNRDGQNTSNPPYAELIITEPVNGATVRNGGNFTVKILAKPRLMSGHRLRLSLDGKIVRETKQTLSFTLLNIDRGEHQLQVDVVNQKNTVLQSVSSTVYVQRAIVRPAK